MPLAWDGPYCPYIHCADDAARPRPWRLPRRRLAHYLLVLSREGEEQIEVEGRRWTIPRDGAYLIPPGVLHTLASAQGNRPAWIHFDVCFDPRRESHPHAGPEEPDLGRRALFLQPGPREVWGVELPVVIPPAALPAVQAGVPRAIAAWRDGAALSRLEAHQELGSLLLALVATALPGRAAPGPDERLRRAEAVARRNLGARMTVAAFAAAAGYSRSRFAAVYRRHRGIAPGVFLRRERLQLAATLLDREDLPVRSVGALVGYDDPTVFGRAFRALHGVTPQRWRARASAPGRS